MTDEETTAADRLREDAEEDLRRANTIHREIDGHKEWSFEASTELKVRAEALHEAEAIDEDELQEFLDAARKIKSVYTRLNLSGA